MSIFDLFFLASVLATVVALIAAAISAARGRGANAVRILRTLGLYLAVYFAMDLAVDFFRPQRVRTIAEPTCLDDWCLQIEKVDRAAAGASISYNVRFRIYSTARRVSQRANGAWIYLVDEEGRRYSPNPDPSATPLSVLLGPEQSVTTTRVFEVPAGVRNLGLITGHGGPYCGAMSLLIIGGGGCLFNRPDMTRLSTSSPPAQSTSPPANQR